MITVEAVAPLPVVFVVPQISIAFRAGKCFDGRFLVLELSERIHKRPIAPIEHLDSLIVGVCYEAMLLSKWQLGGGPPHDKVETLKQASLEIDLSTLHLSLPHAVPPKEPDQFCILC